MGQQWEHWKPKAQDFSPEANIGAALRYMQSRYGRKFLASGIDAQTRQRGSDMPYVVLEVKDDRLLRLIDTENGRVTVVAVAMVSDQEFHASPAEMQEMGKLLGKDVDGRLTRGELTKAVAALEQMRNQMSAMKTTVKLQDERIDDLEKDISKMRERQITGETLNIVATSLELRIVELAETQNIPEYIKAKDAYKKVTGRSWVEED